MTLTDLWAHHFRNFDELSLKLSPRLNLIVGANGMGKTNLLETIHFLGCARSLRRHYREQLIQDGRRRCRVRGIVRRPATGHTEVSVEKDTEGVRICRNGDRIASVSKLVPLFPIQVINPDSHQLLQGGPQFRRRYLDWGVFHVEHRFFGYWKRYTRALRQRNAALRGHEHPRRIRAWDAELVQASLEIDVFRKSYLERLRLPVGEYTSELLSVGEVGLTYRPGWPEKSDLAGVLAQSMEGDLERGFTRYGPHRADLALSIGGHPVKERASRGQQKLLVIALLLAQASLYSTATGDPSLLLVDDLAAELDGQHRGRVMALMQNTNAQLFVTALDPEVWRVPHAGAGAMFHVERGIVTKMI